VCIIDIEEITMSRSHRITAILISALCLIQVSCGGDEEKENKEGAKEKETRRIGTPPGNYMQNATRVVDKARKVTARVSLKEIRQHLSLYTMRNRGKYPRETEFWKMLGRRHRGVTYTGEGLTTRAGAAGVVVHMTPDPGKTKYRVLQADSKVVEVTKQELDRKLKKSELLKGAGLPTKR
jgi:hypothetical protein